MYNLVGFISNRTSQRASAKRSELSKLSDIIGSLFRFNLDCVHRILVVNVITETLHNRNRNLMDSLCITCAISSKSKFWRARSHCITLGQYRRNRNSGGPAHTASHLDNIVEIEILEGPLTLHHTCTISSNSKYSSEYIELVHIASSLGQFCCRNFCGWFTPHTL